MSATTHTYMLTEATANLFNLLASRPGPVSAYELLHKLAMIDELRQAVPAKVERAGV